MKKILLILCVICATVLYGCATENTQTITNFQECVDAGYPIMESYPQQCNDGIQTFVEKRNVTTMTIGPELKECVGVGPQSCMVVNGEYFYDKINGLDYEEGYTYEVEVVVSQRENTAADQSSLAYTLLNIVSKEPAQKACTREYRPVCGDIQVQCITTPCDPVQTTFANQCMAENAGATNIVNGPCVEKVNPQGACLSFDGTWLEESQECVGMSESMCSELGGTYNGCASACRNDPDAVVCTLQCIQVCDFA